MPTPNLSLSREFPDEMLQLCNWLSNATYLHGSTGETRRVLLPEVFCVPERAIIYRYHWQTDAHVALKDVSSRPSFFAKKEPWAAEYRRGTAPAGQQCFLISGPARKELRLAQVASFQVHAQIMNGPYSDLKAKFKNDAVGSQRYITTEVCSRVLKTSLDGFWDNEGHDILICKAAEALHLAITPVI